MTDTRFRRHHVLVVDDEPFTRQLIRGLLQQLGVGSLDDAAEGEAAMASVLRRRPDLVLCDVHMRPVGGIEFLRSLRSLAIPQIARTRVVFLTADAKADTVHQARELGVDGYLVKPVSLGAVEQRLVRLLT